MNESKSDTAAPANRPFVISRVFDAPRDLVWKAWTERDRLMQWFGPKGFTMSTAKLDFRPGGSYHYGMRAPNGTDMWGKFRYREIVPQQQMVLINSFSDEAGGITRHPMRDRPCNNIRMLFLRLRSNSLHSYLMSIGQKRSDQFPRFVLLLFSLAMILLKMPFILTLM